ncbi:Rieske 2Fe-2S domain-containing protein [Catenulispora subtropica]|uniref:Rieske domain-containing protein n=1 Tax=Catenulispora subtropica TaxID=450798 RepID=A0ABP5BTI4_9ACTN
MSAPGRQLEPAVCLLPLRGFLGATYIYAALQKFHDPAFLDPSAPGSFAAQTASFRHTSPIGFALGPAHDHALAFGLLIAFGELAVGLGTVLGLWTRLAAAGGVLLALTFFLTVSWNTDPYYYGSDLGFAFAFLTLGLAGPTRWSMDAWLAAGTVDTSEPEDSRRVVLKRAAATGITSGAALLGAAGAGRLGRSGRSKQSPMAQPRTAVPSATPSESGLQVALAAIPATGAARLTASGGDPVFVARTADGGYKACGGICTHAGCPVGVDQARGLLVCPCHGSTFDPKSGAVINGPAKDPLPSFPVTVADGVLRVRKN